MLLKRYFQVTSGRVRAGCLPNGLPFKRNRKFNDKKAAPQKAAINDGIPLKATPLRNRRQPSHRFRRRLNHALPLRHPIHIADPLG
jgi:hypothetical protein